MTRSVTETLELTELNLLEGYREIGRNALGSRLEEGDGLLMLIGRTPSWIIVNAAHRTDRRQPARAVLERTDRRYADAGHGYCIYALDGHDDDLSLEAVATGLELCVDLPQMVLEESPAPGLLPDGFRMSEVADEVAAAAYALVMQESFEPEVGDLYRSRDSLVGPSKRAWVISAPDGTPASGASIILSHGIALVATVGTRPGYERKGLGGAATRAAAAAAFDAGARFVSLQSSPDAEPMYRRIGFRTIGLYHLYGREGPPA